MRQLRKIKGLTQEELAKKAGLSTMSIRRYESGQRIITAETLHRIADALGVHIFDIVLDENIEDFVFSQDVMDRAGNVKERVRTGAEIKKIYDSWDEITKNKYWNMVFSAGTNDKIEPANDKGGHIVRENDSDALAPGNISSYDVFMDLCKEFDVTPAKVIGDLKISQTTMESWASGNQLPDDGTLLKIAAYFDTTPDYILGNMQTKEAIYPIGSKSGRDSFDSLYTKQLLDKFNVLNISGKREAVKRVGELAELPRYQRRDLATAPLSDTTSDSLQSSETTGADIPTENSNSTAKERNNQED